VKTGKSLNNPSACVKSYEVKVEGTDVKVLL
jgi:nitrite reductase/ring-hydroxylating ferredoxin subunit